MSLYPRFTPTTTGARYNSSDIITKQDISSTSGSGTISLDLSGFMLKSAPVVSSDIYLSNEAGVKFTSGAKQTVPYSDDEVATVAESKLKTSALTYDSGTSKTTVLGTMDLSAADVQLADESVPIAKVVDLTSTIVQIQTNLVQIQTNLSNITSNDEELLALTAADVVHESRMDAIETLDAAQDVRLDAIETLDAAQDGRLDTLEPLVSSHTASLTQHAADIIANASATAAVAADLVTTNGTVDANNTFFLAAKTATDSAVQQNSSDISSNTAAISAADGQITALELADVANGVWQTDQAELNTGQAVTNTSHAASIAAASSRLDMAESTLLSHGSSLSSLTSTTSGHTTSIAGLQSNATGHAASIASNTALVNTKQNTISSSNRVNAGFIGNGDVSSNVLSYLSGTHSNVQQQLTFISDSVASMNILQNSDVINIPAMQTDISEIQGALLTVDSDMTSLESTVGVHTTSLNSLLSSDTAHDTEIAALQSATATNSAGVLALSNQDSTHSAAISALGSADLVLQANIDLKQDLISLSSMLATEKIHDATLGTLSDILSTVYANIAALDTEKQEVLSGVNKLNSLYLDLSTTSLQYVDITAPLKAQLTSITSAINTLQNLTSNDTISTFQDIEDNFDSLQASISTLQASISTLQGLQDGDIVSFASINSSITNLTNTKQPLLNATNSKLDSTFIDTSTSALQYVDVSSSIETSLSGVTSSVSANASAQATVNSAQTATNSAQATVNSTQAATNTSTASSISGLLAYDTAQTAINATQGTTNTATAASIAALESFETAQGTVNSAQATTNSSVATSLTTLQTNIDNVAPAAGNSKIEPTKTVTFANDVLTHTYDEENIFMNQLTANDVFALDLTIDTPANGKTYVQKIIIDALEYKGYCNALSINASNVEIKYHGGDSAVNLAPIAGYSLILQTLEMTRIGNEWYCISKIQLFYNSATNVYYDETVPTITLTGAATITHEVGSAFSDPGYTGTDNIDGDITGDVVVTGAVNDAVLGSYTLYYDVDDTKGNSAVQKARVVDVIDTSAPVVVLVGDSVVDLVVGDSWSDPGATVSDNSGETLTIVEGGDTVDVNTEGAYTITYTATDSSLNAGNTTSRLVNVTVVAYTLEYDNPSTDIFTLADMVTHTAVAPNQTQQLTTVSGNASAYLNGDYAYRTGSMQNGSSYFKNIFTAGNIYASMTLSHTSFVSHLFGNMTDFTGGYVYTAAGDYVGTTMNNGSYSGPVYFAQVDSASSISYDGEFLEIKMPFFVMPSSILLACYNSTYVPKISHLMGSSDGGATYRLIETFVDQAQTMTPTFTGSLKYNAFKYIVSKIGTSGDRVITVARWQMFGKIYTLT